ncbi:glutamine--fructose-6-phosphate transaminase (isomerizing) [Candidatus Microgenomates bacterium]|nr:glutamine--fructose-6-phosphate transaminase (isomerizing) [Candidatus Microgenomates bacterium]
MCGIFAYIGKKQNAAQIVLSGLKKLEYRGYDSWGIAVRPVGVSEICVEKRVGKIGGATITLPDGSIAIGHTRWATHGGVTDENAHPHLDCSKKIAVIHNGIVENHRGIREKLKSRGHRFSSETDTEVIAHLIEDNLKIKPIKQAVFSAFNSLVGSNAITVLDLENETVVACRDGSPLVVGLGKKEYFLASDVTPFLKSTNRVVFIKDGQGVLLTKKGAKIYDLKTGKKEKTEEKLIDWKIEDAQKGGYSHFLLKEIIEQKITIPKTANLNEKEIRNLAEKINQKNKVVMFACGTASYCTLAGKYFFAENGIETQVYGAYEFLPFAKFCNQKTIAIAVSQSGETADTLIAAKKVKARGASIVAVVNTFGSTLERLADYVLPVGAGPEIAVISTKAYTAQLAILYLLANTVSGQYIQARKNIKSLGKNLSRWLTKKLQTKIMKLAKSLMNKEDIYCVGKHLNYPAALECALKIKEASYIHSEGFASGELKHGVISLIQKGTPCIVLAADDETKGEVLSAAAELKARGARIIGISPFPAAEFDDYIQTFDAGQLTFIPNVIVGQLLGYYLSVGRGADPDKPRNLAKSVTVK